MPPQSTQDRAFLKDFETSQQTTSARPASVAARANMPSASAPQGYNWQTGAQSAPTTSARPASIAAQAEQQSSTSDDRAFLRDFETSARPESIAAQAPAGYNWQTQQAQSEQPIFPPVQPQQARDPRYNYQTRSTFWLDTQPNKAPYYQNNQPYYGHSYQPPITFSQYPYPRYYQNGGTYFNSGWYNRNPYGDGSRGYSIRLPYNPGYYGSSSGGWNLGSPGNGIQFNRNGQIKGFNGSFFF